MKNLFMNCGPLSASTKLGTYIQIYQVVEEHIITRCVDVIFSIGIARESLENQSVTVTSCWLPDGTFDSPPIVSMATNSSYPAAGNS